MRRRTLPCVLIALFTCGCLFSAQAATPTSPPPTTAPPATLAPEPTKTPQPTRASTATDLPMPTATATTVPSETPLPTATLSATPQPSAQMNTNANLWQGPGVVYPVIQSVPKDAHVLVLERDVNVEWFHVQIESGKDGWVSIKVIVYTFDPVSIPLALVIPPTAAYTLPPAATSTQLAPTEALPQDVHITITNSLSVAVYLYLKGPQNYSFNIAAGQTIEVFVASGRYYFVASASGFTDLTGNKEWSAGDYT